MALAYTLRDSWMVVERAVRWVMEGENGGGELLEGGMLELVVQ